MLMALLSEDSRRVMESPRRCAGGAGRRDGSVSGMFYPHHRLRGLQSANDGRGGQVDENRF